MITSDCRRRRANKSRSTAEASFRMLGYLCHQTAALDSGVAAVHKAGKSFLELAVQHSPRVVGISAAVASPLLSINNLNRTTHCGQSFPV